MKKIQYLIFFCMISLSVLCQKNDVSENKFCINTPPLTLIDIYGGMTYRLGAEVKVYNNFAVFAEGGGYFYNGGYKENQKGFVTRTGFKLYLNRERLAIGNYIAVEHTYKNLHFDLTDSFYVSPGPAIEKMYRVGRSANSVVIKFGTMQIYKDHFVVEWYAGMGLRFEFSSSDLSPALVEVRKENDGAYISDFERKLGSWTVPVVNVGFKVGYRIK